jgi:hypothetical protein
MKKIVLILLVISNLHIHAQNCSVPVSDMLFIGLKSQIQQSYNGALALQKGKDIARTNCFTANQAKDLMLLFAQDLSKTELGKVIYSNVIDKSNFNLVYDYYTNVLALVNLVRFVSDYDLVQQAQQNTIIDRSQIIFPVLEQYVGRKITNQPAMNTIAFNPFKATVMDANIYVQLQKTLINDRTKFFSMTQVMDLALLFNDANQRLQVVQHYIAQTIDIDNYPFVLQLFNNGIAKNNYVQSVQFFIANNLNGNGGNGTICLNAATDNEVATMKDNLDKIPFSATKVKQYKALLRNKCLTTAQIKTLISLFNIGDRLDLLKYSYDFCSDVKNYYTLSNLLTFNRDIESFSAFLMTK